VTAVKHREPNLVPTFMPEMSPQPDRRDRSKT
jgi:hypothetical protein